MPRPKKSPTITPKAYSVSITTTGGTYEANADTILEAFEQLNPPRPFKGKAIIRVQAGEMSSELNAYPPVLNRLFVNRVAREILQKRMALALK